MTDTSAKQTLASSPQAWLCPLIPVQSRCSFCIWLVAAEPVLTGNTLPIRPRKVHKLRYRLSCTTLKDFCFNLGVAQNNIKHHTFSYPLGE